MKRLIIILVLLIFVLLAPYGCTVFGIRFSEEPDYKVMVQDGDFEIRDYPKVIIAETFVEGEFREAGNKSFRILGGYIFGNNIKKQKIEMTVPVVQKQESESISMTIPVVQEKSTKGWHFAFVMPSEYTLETLPKPISSEIVLREVESAKVAVIRFSGSYGDEKVSEKTEKLRSWVSTKGYSIVSTSRTAWYDPPWTILWFRRNEIQFDVEVK